MSRLAPLLAAAAVLVLPGLARANCAKPVGYEVKVEANKVTVCPDNFGERACPDEGLLRKAVSGGDTVKLTDCDTDKKCFVDECVPPGSYQYGYAKPYACHSSSCGTAYFATAEVTAALGNCTRTTGVAGPSPFADGAPWGSDSNICSYGGLGGCGCSSTSAAVLMLNGGALAAGLVLLRRRRAR